MNELASAIFYGAAGLCLVVVLRIMWLGRGK